MQLGQEGIYFRDCRQILVQVLSELQQINKLLFLLKSVENQKFSDDFRENKTYLICLFLFAI